MTSARLVIIAADVTDGLAWELAQVVAYLDPQHLLIALPSGRVVLGPIDGAGQRRQRCQTYEQVKAMTDALFPTPLSQTIGDTTFLCFDNQWTPRRSYRIPAAIFRTPHYQAWLRAHMAKAVLFFPLMGLLQHLLLIAAVIAAVIALIVSSNTMLNV